LQWAIRRGIDFTGALVGKARITQTQAPSRTVLDDSGAAAERPAPYVVSARRDFILCCASLNQKQEALK
jgi:hypothetical protein